MTALGAGTSSVCCTGRYFDCWEIHSTCNDVQHLRTVERGFKQGCHIAEASLKVCVHITDMHINNLPEEQTLDRFPSSTSRAVHEQSLLAARSRPPQAAEPVGTTSLVAKGD